LIAVFPEPLPCSRVGLHEDIVAFVAEGDADPVHPPAEEIVYPAMLA
jgi:hypothetical protein